MTAGWESLQTPDILPLDTLETLLIGPYAAFHMGQFLILRRVLFLSLFLADSLVGLSLPFYVFPPFIQPLFGRFHTCLVKFG